MRRSLMFAVLSLVAIVVVGVPAATAQAPSGYALYLPFDDGGDPTNNLAVGNDGFLEPDAGPVFSTDIPLVDGNVKSLSFDGIDDYVTVASYAALEPAGAFTVSLWAKSSDPGDVNPHLISKGAQGFFAGTFSLYSDGSGDVHFDVSNAPSYAATPGESGVWDGVWHNITGVYSPGSIELYVDGALTGSSSVGFVPLVTQGALTIGDYSLSSPLYNFSGLIDEVFFYGRALSDWEVKGIADRHAVRSAKVSGPIVAHDSITLTSSTDKAEPDFAFEGTIYQGTMTVWGSISVNYKLLGPKTCAFTAGESTVMNFYTGANPDRVDIRNLLNSCDGGYYSIQLMERGDPLLPRGGVFITQMPGDYAPSSAYELQSVVTLPYDWYVPFDRGNVVFWNAG